jgi:hypothetical protein
MSVRDESFLRLLTSLVQIVQWRIRWFGEFVWGLQDHMVPLCVWFYLHRGHVPSSLGCLSPLLEISCEYVLARNLWCRVVHRDSLFASFGWRDEFIRLVFNFQWLWGTPVFDRTEIVCQRYLASVVSDHLSLCLKLFFQEERWYCSMRGRYCAGSSRKWSFSTSRGSNTFWWGELRASTAHLPLHSIRVRCVSWLLWLWFRRMLVLSSWDNAFCDGEMI